MPVRGQVVVVEQVGLERWVLDLPTIGARERLDEGALHLCSRGVRIGEPDAARRAQH